MCRYDAAFHVNVSRVDRASFLLLYPKFIELTTAYKVEYGWNESRITSRSRCSPCSPVDRWFLVKDVGLNSVYAAAWRVMMELAVAVNDTATAQLCAKEADISTRAILSKMYVAPLGGFRSLYVDWDGQEKVSEANVVQNLMPLLLPTLPRSVADALIAEVRSSYLRKHVKTPVLTQCRALLQLQNDQKFNSTFPLPTVAMDDSHVRPRRHALAPR